MNTAPRLVRLATAHRDAALAAELLDLGRFPGRSDLEDSAAVYDSACAGELPEPGPCEYVREWGGVWS
jgi:hypothetical protein